MKVSIGSLGDWVGQTIVLSSEDESDNKKDVKNDKELVGVVHSDGHEKVIDLASGFLGPSFYHCEDDGDYAKWLKEYLHSEFDVMVTSHHACLSDDILRSRSGDYSLLEPCEVLTKEEWILGD